ncbi:MAG TPA: amino acid adenylation domain-containing protein [Candidatus Obscuribacterales bacterium]
MSDLAKRIVDLSPEQLERLLQQLQQQQADRPARSITPQPRTTRYFPLSFAQQRLWFLDQLEPNSPFYNVPMAIRLRGTLQVSALEQTLHELVHRHEVLRTHIAVMDGEPMQVIGDPALTPLQLVNVSHLPQMEQDAVVQQRAIAESNSPFNLGQSPLWRAILLRLSEQEHVLLFTLHHIISDAWSKSVLVQDVTALYPAFCQGQPSPLPDLPIQYADFAVWQRQYLQSGVWDAQLTYWKQKLAGSLPGLPLPTRGRSHPITHQGRKQSFVLPLSLTEALKALSWEENSTLFITLLTAFKVLLYRYTGQTDVVVGSPIANRNQPEIEKLIGFFVNTLVLRSQVDGDLSFRQVLRQVRQVVVEAQAHQDLPFEKLVEALRPDRNLNRNPLFQVMLAFQTAATDELQLPGLTLEPLDIADQTAKFDLGIGLSDSRTGLRGVVEYKTDVFDDATIERLVGHFQTLLEGAIANPDQRIAALPLITSAECQLLLTEWVNPIAGDASLCLHQGFEAQVERSPDAIAVIDRHKSFTYRELNQRANQLAHTLRQQGVKPETRVGLFVERSLDMLVALFGILKAGGAYVPIDPAYPAERIALILADAQVSLVLTQSSLAEQFSHPNVICLDRDWTDIASHGAENPVNQTHPENLAYLIYTSGSTGTPKGVMTSHQAVVNYITAAGQIYDIKPGDRVLQFASIGFDAATEEIFPTLAQGATLVLRSETMLNSIPEFWQQCDRLHLSVLDLPTAFWHQLTAAIASTPLPASLRLVIIGGEAADQAQLQVWQQHYPQVRLVNSYGPTETTIVATLCDVSGANAIATAAHVPIGQSVPQVQTYVLDALLQPVPMGIPGELYIGGTGVARGYWQRPDLTATHFIPHPFSQKAGDRLYKTGDRVRYRSDRQLEFLGRSDNQLKLRGFRIELGEIEAILKQHPAIQDAAVVLQDGTHPRLVGYVVPDSTADVSTAETEAEPTHQQTTQWQAVFDHLYSQAYADQQPAFYIKGWESSYTGEPMLATEVQAWMEQTVARVLALQPSRVLELGCGGSGLMLFRVAPQCSRYWATDLSANALQILQNQVHQLGLDLPNVTFLQRGADDFSGVEPHSFNAVLIVSVAQYFPSIDYLLTVLQKAVDVVEPGSSIFLGDIRSLPLLEAFHTSVQLYRATPTTTRAELRQRVQKQVIDEKQLVIDPAFFQALQQELPQISRVEILLERGTHANELTKFRYDVVLHIGKAAPAAEVSWLDWQADLLTVSDLRQRLIETEPDLVAIAHIPNARLSTEIATMQWLYQADPTNIPETIAEFQAALPTQAAAGVDPEALWSLADSLPYTVEICWETENLAGQYQVILRRRGTDAETQVVNPLKTPPLRPWRDYANAPLQAMLTHQLIPQLRHYLAEKLPDYMVPATYVMLSHLPLTPNGKVDRRALPDPEPIQPNENQSCIEPRSPLEAELAKIWAEVLGVTRVGIQDSFFDLGGHSLLMTQLLTQVRQHFQVDLALRELYEAPTVAELATMIETTQRGKSQVAQPAISQVDWATEQLLDSSIRPAAAAVAPFIPPQHIFLTGATGFVGAFLLRDLLEQTDAEIHCLVRADTIASGQQRLRQTLKHYHLWNEAYRDRLHPVLGNLADPQLGLTSAQFQALAAQVDRIYHNGAWVNSVYPYAMLKPANVLGTQEVLRLACHTRSKPMHFISTLSVFGGSGEVAIREESPLTLAHLPDSGYSQSKWVAEQLVTQAKDRGLPVCIYRLGRIAGHSQTGVGNVNDLMSRMIKGCIQLGSVPDRHTLLDITPIDYVSQAIAHLSQQHQSIGKTFHLLNPQPTSWQTLTTWLKDSGYPLQSVPYDQWRMALLQSTDRTLENALAPLVGLFSAQSTHAQPCKIQESLVDCQQTLKTLRESAITCPTIDHNLLNRYLTFWTVQEFLAKPAQSPTRF